ncbi:ATP-binding protein [Massilia sp. erpn]|uniref:ATP-binding protein n=1 Tax=Massilia sp. erpn TaxID=2738142 RepID=UPI002106F17E|nr:ATP-binding protein [Massilia sp. erpn]UTY56262.1 HAMP domain-containing protein [Massilia sp. erpn]
MRLPLRVKFLLLSAFVLALVVGVLIANSLRLMENAVSRNAERVAHEYAVTLNLTLSPYASTGRLNELSSYWNEMLAEPRDSLLRYIVVLDASGRSLAQAGEQPLQLPALLRRGKADEGGVRTLFEEHILHVRAPLLLNQNEIGSLNFGLSTAELGKARDEVMLQGSAIALTGFGVGLLLFVALTHGIGRRLQALTEQSQQLAQGQYGRQLPERGGDELQVFTHSLNTMSAALRDRILRLEESELRLSESEARFHTLFDMTPLPLSVSGQDGRVLTANRALLRTFHRELGDVVGKRSDELPFWASPVERNRIWQLHQRQGAVRGEVADVQLPDGSQGSVTIWSSSLLLDGQQAIIWALLDLTQERKAKDALQELNASLEHRVRERSAELEHANSELSHTLDTLKRTQHDLIAAEKMASLGSLVAGIAHELNTPIGNSLLASTALRDRVEEFDAVVAAGSLRRSALISHLEEVRMACGLISSSLQKAAELIASFKQIAVDQTNDQRRCFSLLTVVSDTTATFMPRLRRANCRVSLDVPSSLMLDSYPGSLYQIFTNLLNNALMHAFEGRSEGQIVIHAQAGESELAEISFSDDGVGMSEEVRRHVFDPFFTTKMGQGGTGLGMNIVYNIVSGVLGGRIAIDSAPGAGTVIRISLPLSSPLYEAAR